MSMPLARTWATLCRSLFALTKLVWLAAQVFRRRALNAQVAAAKVEQRPANLIATRRLNNLAQVHRVVARLDHLVDVAAQIGDRLSEDRQAGAPERVVGVAESTARKRRGRTGEAVGDCLRVLSKDV